ncbi:hypothetical protein ACJJIU_10100 [Microbulbifer sp. CnH-101-E]|uniref:hypothetical protein n=1 Tax=unclassified Microbulbifer TaxID=2619833 RepID=UPI004039AAD0
MKRISLIVLSLFLCACAYQLPESARMKASSMTQEEAISIVDMYLGGTGVGEGVCANGNKVHETANNPYIGVHGGKFFYESFYLDNCKRTTGGVFNGAFSNEEICDVIPFKAEFDLTRINAFIVRTIPVPACNLQAGAIQLNLYENVTDHLNISIPEEGLDEFLAACTVLNPGMKIKNAY